MTPPDNPDVATLVGTADRLINEGHGDEALALLTEANRRVADPAIEVLLVTARHRSFAAPVETATATPWPPPFPDLFPDVEGIPEVSAKEVSVAHLGSALEHHGSLVVRGLVSPTVAQSLCDEIRLAFEAAESAADGAAVSETSPWYVPFNPGEGFDFGGIERIFSRMVGAVLAVEAPRALFHVIEALSASGIGDLIAEYVGEHPALSAKKTSLRRAAPDSPTEWHQDGAFLGDGIRTVNVWTALTPCGTDAPSVDVFPRPFDSIVDTGTDDALFDWSVSPEQAHRLGTEGVVRPVFAPGDALLFNQMTLHRTGITAKMTKERYAIESWFFAPSTYPYEQVPLAF